MRIEGIVSCFRKNFAGMLIKKKNWNSVLRTNGWKMVAVVPFFLWQHCTNRIMAVLARGQIWENKEDIVHEIVYFYKQLYIGVKKREA